MAPLTRRPRQSKVPPGLRTCRSRISRWHADSFAYRWLALSACFLTAQRDPSHGEQAPRSRDEAPGARRGHGALADARGVEPGQREEEPTDREAPEHRERPRDLPQVRVPSGLDPRTVLENSGELERYVLKASTDSLGLSFFLFIPFLFFISLPDGN